MMNPSEVSVKAEKANVRCGPGSVTHLFSNLSRIDERIKRQVEKIRQTDNGKDEYKGLFISEQEIDRLLVNHEQICCSHPEHECASSAGEEGIVDQCECRFFELSRLFGLNGFDRNALLICLAPELDHRYEKLYGYLQDDVTKKRPSVDLILSLLCPSFELKLECRRRLGPASPLVENQLIQLFDDPTHPHPTLLSQFVRVDQRVVNYLLGSDNLDVRLRSCCTTVVSTTSFNDLATPAEYSERLKRIASVRDQSVILYLQGATAEDRELTVCAVTHNNQLLIVDGKRLAGNPDDFQQLCTVAFREALLQRAALYWADFDAYLADDKSTLLATLLSELTRRKGLTFLGGVDPWEPAGELPEALFLRTEVHRPTYTERQTLWMRTVGEIGFLELSSLSSKFKFTAAQIRNASRTARNLAKWNNAEVSDVQLADVYEACRLQCNRKLTSLTRKIKPHYTWNDIILPADRIQQLREICNSLKYRSLVYEQWGFEGKLALGKGLNILFAGPPGTGKTMAADIMAGELGLDLYKTDLSIVVSKYIGETEKNLSRIFAEAETSNSILFFDEADALFGKRSEVRDSHDRYANIETNYLLQKMEEHEGVVILATNFRKNMDEAFVRRLNFTVDFPFPDEHDRRRIWESIWPKETPRQMEIDLRGIAKRFEIAGGNIRNIALGAAFLAADNGGIVTMQHLLHATRREYQKMGKVVGHGEFE